MVRHLGLALKPLLVFFLFSSLRMVLGNESLTQSSEQRGQIRIAIEREISSLNEILSRVCKHEYHGTVRILKNKPNSYLAVNTLDIEDFLLGVVSMEMDPKGPLEALKAQAIAARSHALYQISISQDLPYDLVANISQAYTGKPKLQKNVILAIEATRGQILYYKNKPVAAYFHASCGGHTETIRSIWQSESEIKNNRDVVNPGSAFCAYCTAAPENKWNFKISVASLQRILKLNGYRIGSSPSIRIAEKAPGGHAISIAIQSETSKITLSAEKFRSLLGYSNLRSTLFETRRDLNPDGSLGDTFAFQGCGYGHGVGLCQFGAQEMALRGASYEKILFHYFPGCRIHPCSSVNFASN